MSIAVSFPEAPPGRLGARPPPAAPQQDGGHPPVTASPLPDALPVLRCRRGFPAIEEAISGVADRSEAAWSDGNATTERINS